MEMLIASSIALDVGEQDVSHSLMGFSVNLNTTEGIRNRDIVVGYCQKARELIAENRRLAMNQREQGSEEDVSPRARLLQSLRLSDPRPTAQIRENHLAEQIILPPTEHHHLPYRQHTSLPADALPRTNKTPNQSSSVEAGQNPLDNPPHNTPRLDNPPTTMATPPNNPTGATGTASATAPLSDTTFTLHELLTAALHGTAYDIGSMLFTPAANQDTNPDLANLLHSVRRARVDPDYAEKRARFVTEALQIQKRAAPGQGVEDA